MSLDAVLKTFRRLLSRGGVLCIALALAAACLGLQCPGGTPCGMDADCDDEVFCNGAETCNTTTMTCEDGTAPCDADEICLEDAEACVDCETDTDCDDGDACTTDMCDANMDCVNTPIMCDPGDTCVDGECVSDMPDPCEGVTCETCEECVDGVCMALEGMVAAGETFYMDNGCGDCHGATGSGPPDITDNDCASIFDKISGAVGHVGGIVDGATEQDAADVVAWLASLGQ